jgi:putative aldouronate transport system substrate-binding protein
LDAFDRYVEQWKQEGGSLITEEVNQWYRANGGKDGKGGGTP